MPWPPSLEKAMVERSLRWASEAMGGQLLSGAPGALFCGVAIDSRRLSGGELFFAFVGEHADGHDYVAAALAGGAGGAVISRQLADPPGGALIQVEDTLRALHQLTSAARREVPEKLVAITGSVGKTTTKEILAALLASRFRVAKSVGNFNNLYGFPLSLLAVAEDCQWMVAEMGMSEPGELGKISRLGRPDVALFTNVRPVHLENFPDLRGIADAKSELLEGLVEGGLVIANADDPWVMRIAALHAGEVVTYGRGAKATVRIEDLRPLDGRPGSAFKLSTAGRSVDVELSLYGLYNADNFLAAAACAVALGVDLDEIAAAAKGLAPASHRGEVHRLAGAGSKHSIVLIDDAYNSNPDAAERALESALQLDGQRYVAVLGDMLELGPTAAELHRQVGERAAELGFGLVLGVGELSRATVAGAASRQAETEWLADAAGTARRLPELLREGDVVLVKGSRGVGLEAVVAALCAGKDTAAGAAGGGG
nr:UDP-N-acetylmuramoyl-tripeptide--D-alanyl-D-alanine ligase-like [Nerophis lumbriciformis]